MTGKFINVFIDRKFSPYLHTSSKTGFTDRERVIIPLPVAEPDLVMYLFTKQYFTERMG